MSTMKIAFLIAIAGHLLCGSSLPDFHGAHNGLFQGFSVNGFLPAACR